MRDEEATKVSTSEEMETAAAKGRSVDTSAAESEESSVDTYAKGFDDDYEEKDDEDDSDAFDWSIR